MRIRRYNLKFLIMVFILIIGIFNQSFANRKTDLISSTEARMSEPKKKKTKKQKSVEQSLSLLQEHLPQYGTDVLEEANTKAPYQMFQFVNFSDSYISDGLFSAISFRNNLIKNIINWLGTPYRYGGKNMKGVDCSGFTSNVINETIGEKVLVGSSRMQIKLVKKVFSKDSLQIGDLLFFAKTKISKKINHVAIYLGNNLFAHSSTSRGVVVSKFDSNYSNRYRFGGRLPYQWNYASL